MGKCTFRTINNEASVEVTWGTRDICDGFSPQVPEGCDFAQLTVVVNGAGAQVMDANSQSFTCIAPGSCTRSYNPLSNVTLQANVPMDWTDGCSACGTNSTVCTVALGASGSELICRATATAP